MKIYYQKKKEKPPTTKQFASLSRLWVSADEQISHILSLFDEFLAFNQIRFFCLHDSSDEYDDFDEFSGPL